MQSIGLGTLIQAITALLVFVFGIGATAFAWYMKNHVISEVEKNSQFRRYAGGTNHQNDDGTLGDLRKLLAELEDLSARMENQHTEVAHKVDYVIEYCERIAEAVEADVSAPPRKWGDDEAEGSERTKP